MSQVLSVDFPYSKEGFSKFEFKYNDIYRDKVVSISPHSMGKVGQLCDDMYQAVTTIIVAAKLAEGEKLSIFLRPNGLNFGSWEDKIHIEVSFRCPFSYITIMHEMAHAAFNRAKTIHPNEYDDHRIMRKWVMGAIQIEFGFFRSMYYFRRIYLGAMIRTLIKRLLKKKTTI